jgi:Icc protein
MNRRQFFSLGAFATASIAAPFQDWPALASQPGSFDFIFFTDTHTQPELAAATGCAMCFRKIRSTVKADFAIQGGDHVFDASTVDRKRANSLFDLYANIGLRLC